MNIEDLKYRLRKFIAVLRLGLEDLISRFSKQPAPPSYELKEEEFARMRPITPKDVATVPEKYIKMIGTLKADLAKLVEENKKLKEKLERMSEERKKELIKEIEMERELIVRTKQMELLNLKNIPKDVRVLSRDHKFLGYFYSIFVGDGNLHVVVSERPFGKGKKYKVWSAPSLDVLVHNADNITDQLRNKVLILNRTYDPPVYIPDLELKLPKFPYLELKGGMVLCTLCGKVFEDLNSYVEHYSKEHLGTFGGGDGEKRG